MEPFALIPRDALESEALKTAPHAAVRVLLILVMGNPKERNGTFACTDSYAAKYGFNSHETVSNSLKLLRQRGVIVITRQGMRMRKIPTLNAVTWWPIYNHDGQPLDKPSPPTFAYRKWQPITPTTDVETDFHTDHRCIVTPTTGVERVPFHPDSLGNSAQLRPDYREYSKNLGAGFGNNAVSKVTRLMTELPHLGDADISKITNEPIEFVQQVRARA